MKIIIAVSTIILALSSILILIRELRESRLIYFGKISSIGLILKNSLLIGLALSIFFLAFVFAVNLLDKNFGWSVFGLFVILIISLLLGLFVFIGTFIGYIIVGKYRGILYNRLSDKSDKTDKR